MRKEPGEHRANAIVAHRDTRIFGCGCDATDDVTSQLIDLGINIFVIAQVTHSGETSSHRQRISRERSCLINRSQRRNQIHDLAWTAISAHWQTSANYFSHRRQIGLDPIKLLRSTECQAKSSHDLVENQQRFVVRGNRSQSLEISARWKTASHIAHNRLHDDASDLVLEFFECLCESANVVE